MKGVLLSLIFMACSLLGIWIDRDQQKRIKELGQFIYLFELLKGEIEYQLTPMIEASQTISEFTLGGVSRVFQHFSKALQQGENRQVSQMWQQAIDKEKAYLHLTEEDYKILTTFGGSCGYLDKNMQRRNLEMILEKLTQQKKISEEKYARCSKLNRCLGMLVGIVLVIFFI